MGQTKVIAIAGRNAAGRRRWSKVDEWLAGARGSPERGIDGGMTVDRRGAVRITDGP